MSPQLPPLPASEPSAIALLREDLANLPPRPAAPPPATPATSSPEAAAAPDQSPASRSPLPPSRRQSRRSRQSGDRFHSGLWSFLWLTATICFGGVGLVAFHWLTQLPPATDCRELTPLSADVERLHCAQIAAQAGTPSQLVTAMKLVQDWKPGHPFYTKAQESMADWSEVLLNMARSSFQAGDLNEAVKIAGQVPPASPLYDQAQGQIRQWQDQWARGNKIYQAAIAALKQQNWTLASEQVTALGQLEQPYWRQTKADELSLRILKEKEMFQILRQAREMAAGEQPDQMTEAIALVADIDPQTYIWEAARRDRQQWSQALVAQALQYADGGDLPQAMALAQALTLEPFFSRDAADLIRLSHAHQFVGEPDAPWEPSLTSLWGLLEGVAAARQILPDSRFYNQAQEQIALWEDHLSDLSQLYLAQVVADFDQRSAFKVAIAQAAMVPSDHPRRLQAQTLMAHWGQEVQRIEDRPHLQRAEQLAATDTLEGLRAAVDQAQTISPDRALGPEAEQAVAGWVRQIQTLEDQPIVARARELANSGDWDGAIAEAEKIGSDRALYGEAQAIIRDVQNQIFIAQERSRLEEARSLASQVRLTRAIRVASQISPNSGAVYEEAQAAIAEWERQRAEIWEQQQQPAPPSSDPTPSPVVQPAPSPRVEPAPSNNQYDGYFGSGN
ncbi:MAG: hypothetical protein VKK04_18660 [Synechococcales bacterium]|nr:hypothetical protein [Synechococcales bacterium]